MFTPRELALERGWPGRIDGDWVVQLAAQTLEAFFSSGGKAREHNVYPLGDVALRAPVLRPPGRRRPGAPVAAPAGDPPLSRREHVRVREHRVDLRPRRRGARAGAGRG